MLKPLSFIPLFLCVLMSVSVVAQEICPTAETLIALNAACSTSDLDSACNSSGTITPLDQLANDESAQLIRLSGASEGTITLTLVETRLTAYEQGEIVGAGIEIGNSAGYNVNLRSGAGSSFEVVGIFRFDERLITDGQSADGAWLRVLLDDGTIAWVSKSLVSNDPTLATLPIVEGDASGTMGHVLTFERADSPCAEGQAGVFITTESDTTQRLTVNDLPVTLTDAALFMSLDESGVTFYALAGSGTVGIGENQQTLESGDVITWVDEPLIPDPMLPLPALDIIEALAIEPEICLVAAMDANTDPGAPLDIGMSYIVDALRTSDSGLSFRLSTSAVDENWVIADRVRTLGACDSLPDADAVVSSPVFGAGQTPEQIMYSYLSARLVADASQMQSLSCATWDSQALLQSQSFRAMRAELLNVACYTVSQTGSNAVVQCDGVIQTEYNGELRQWELGAYAMTQESGAWRLCGETR